MLSHGGFAGFRVCLGIAMVLCSTAMAPGGSELAVPLPPTPPAGCLAFGAGRGFLRPLVRERARYDKSPFPRLGHREVFEGSGVCLPSPLSPLSPPSTAMAEKSAGVDARVCPETEGASSEKAEIGVAGAVFVYGTLMHEKVLMALLGRVPKTWKARLDGYHRYRIKGYNFPGVRPKEGSSVEGLYMPGLDAREKLIFDLFEDEEYHKVDVRVEIEGHTGTQLATVYVWNASAEDQLFSTWEPSEHFVPDGKIVRDYVTMVEGFALEIQEEVLLLQAGEN